MEQVAVLSARPLFISVITYGEVYEGVSIGAERLATLVNRTRVLPVDRGIAERWAAIRHELRQRGALILDANMLTRRQRWSTT